MPQQTSESYSGSASTNSPAPPQRPSLAEPALLIEGQPSKLIKTTKAIVAVLEERRIAAELAAA